MFGLFKRKKEVKLLKEDTKNGFDLVKKDINSIGKWIEHLEIHQFEVIDIISNDMSKIKEKLGVSNMMASCHTAVVNDYVIEGHVPADDIKQLLLDKPAHIKGLSVPQMPVGTPGMEMGLRKDHFIVFSFDDDTQYQLFNAYQTNAENNYLPLNHAE